MTYPMDLGPTGLGTDDKAIREQLHHDEQLLWSGRPDPAKWLAPGDLYLIPFSLVWCGMLGFIGWTAVASSNTPWPPKLMLALFVVAGAYLLVGRHILKWRAKRQTGYGLTDTRAIIVGPRGRVTDVRLDSVPIDQRPSRDGRHLSITFGDNRSSFWSRGNTPQNVGMDFFHQGPPAFYDVADVDGLRQALRRVER